MCGFREKGSLADSSPPMSCLQKDKVRYASFVFL
ncbi:hypothetical protein COLO4_22213 [Corchorus olitorius]|uniref:Uncharacterized protein n=1 Tax=Corchorus olitorius TaxID=93759 RepID=A0A1R3INI7_9ROSI|nr:hypothetical protein COLO4_22213 [Corchorus olitorius]